jgi:hypothetical protein
MPINADSGVSARETAEKKGLAWILSLQVRWNGECHCGFFCYALFLLLSGEGERI